MQNVAREFASLIIEMSSPEITPVHIDSFRRALAVQCNKFPLNQTGDPNEAFLCIMLACNSDALTHLTAVHTTHETTCAMCHRVYEQIEKPLFAHHQLLITPRKGLTLLNILTSPEELDVVACDCPYALSSQGNPSVCGQSTPYNKFKDVYEQFLVHRRKTRPFVKELLFRTLKSNYHGGTGSIMNTEFNKLNPGEYLNDTIINAYMSYLDQRDHRLYNTGVVKFRTIFVSTFWTSTMSTSLGRYVPECGLANVG